MLNFKSAKGTCTGYLNTEISYKQRAEPYVCICKIEAHTAAVPHTLKETGALTTFFFKQTFPFLLMKQNLGAIALGSPVVKVRDGKAYFLRWLTQ